jgi:cysteine desulfurase
MIYFDNAATTPTLKGAEEIFIRENREVFANPSSPHAFGREAAKKLEEAREEMLKDLRLEKSHSLIFTSGATESNNLALKGLAFHYQKRGKRIITSSIEHPSVLNVLKELKDFGFDIVVLPVTPEGKVDPLTLKAAMNNETILVSIMAVNNEIGSVNDLKTLASIVHAYPKAYFHVDATQAITKIPFDYADCDLLSFSGHKFGAFKGSGALIYKKSIAFESVNAGGEQENGFRAGTVNMPGDLALAYALDYGLKNMASHEQSVRELQGYLRKSLSEMEGIELNSPADAMPYVLNFSLLKKKASVVVEALSENEIYVSSVSACSSEEPVSYVLEAMGKSEDLAKNSIRLSFSADNTLEEGKRFLEAFQTIMQGVNDR